MYWVILGFVLEGVFHFFSTYRFLNLLENLCFIAITIFVIGNIRNTLLRRKLYYCFIVLIVIMIWFETLMYYHFKISFGPSSLYVISNTNPDELLEFVKEFIDIKVFIVSVLFFIPLLKLKSIVNSLEYITPQYQLKKHRLAKLGCVVLVFFVTIKFTKLIDHNLPYLFGRSIVLNYKDSQWVEGFNAKLNTNTNLVKNNNEDVNSTYIIVIGESTTSSHMQLYGYYRKTTALLEKQKDSLSIYNDVISPHTSTFYSLSKSFTLGNYEEPKKLLALPITSLFNKSGFKTFWISNHSPAFNPNSALARIANESKSLFYNTKEAVINNLKHDGELIAAIDEALNDSFSNKVIFLHLIGAHFSYENRYPPEFDRFVGKPKTKFNNEKAFEKINQYDNAISYSDFIVSQVLDKLKAEKSNSYLMFFSDHGEEVFQDENFYGHFEDRPSKNTFKIPFLLWYSKDFRFPDDYEFDENRKYMTDDLWHSIAHISGLKSQLIDVKRSIFSAKFVNRKRIILQDKIYDSFFE